MSSRTADPYADPQAATLAARLDHFVHGPFDADEIPGMVRDVLAHGPADYDLASAAMNAEADAIRDGHDGEYSVTIREDDRANLFTNVAGWMLEHDSAAGLLTDAEIVTSAIEDNYSAGPEEVRGWSE